MKLDLTSLTEQQRQHAYRMAETLWANGKGHPNPRAVAMSLAYQQPEGSLPRAFWRAVAGYAAMVVLL